MLDGLLKEQIRADPDISGMLAKYKGKSAFFYQKSPPDTDRGWENPYGESSVCFPCVDYSINTRYDPEREIAGSMTINIRCTAESAAMPEDIEDRLIALINGAFYVTRAHSENCPQGGGLPRTDRQSRTVCAIWNRSDALRYEMPVDAEENTAPEVVGVSLSFDLIAFPEQLSIDPDPVQALNKWTRDRFPDITIINHQLSDVNSIWRPTDEHPAIYWRFEGVVSKDRQANAVTWYNGSFAAHVIADTATERNRWTKAIIERLQMHGEVLLADGSPMFAKQIAVRHSADPLRKGQLILSAQYGVLEQHRKKRAEIPLNHATLTWEPQQTPDFRLEVSNGRNE